MANNMSKEQCNFQYTEPYAELQEVDTVLQHKVKTDLKPLDSNNINFCILHCRLNSMTLVVCLWVYCGSWLCKNNIVFLGTLNSMGDSLTSVLDQQIC